jgi:thiamine-monophosphate kinase
MTKPFGELALIEQIRTDWANATSKAVALGIGDDCAILRPPAGHEILVTTDFTLEGRHFRRDWHSPESVGHRCLARGLSDLAAMGARPLGAFLSLALPPELVATKAGRVWLERFFAGMRALSDRFAVPLAGGDTAESPSALMLADIVLVGSAPTGRALRRSGGRLGDFLYVTGSLGGAAAELRSLVRTSAPARKQSSAPGANPQMFPEPRLTIGQTLLRRKLANAAIDLSDGLSTDLAHLCQQSRAGAEIEAAALPIHPLAVHAGEELKAALGATGGALQLALNGGEDYELLFAAPASVKMPRSIAGTKITRIGRLVPGSTISLIQTSGLRTPLNPGGWEHFATATKPRKPKR